MQKEIVNWIGRFKKYIAYSFVLLTIGIFWLYFRAHPKVLDPVKNIPLYVIPLLLLLYLLFLITNFLISFISIKACQSKYPPLQTFEMTVYSSLVNFFGPLQSGLGFRAFFLKKQIGIKVRDFMSVTILYYLSFAAISLFMLFSAKNLLVAAVVIVSLAVLAYYYVVKRYDSHRLIGWLAPIFLVTLLQLSIVSTIYYVELHVIGVSVSLPALLSYTGSANLALFVALTPGAVGVRESFIYFAQSLHGIPTNVVVAANVLDRAIYVLFLLGLFVISSTLKLGEKFRQTR